MKALFVVAGILALAMLVGGGLVMTLFAEKTAYPLPVANITVSPPSGVAYRQLTTGAWNDRYPAVSGDGRTVAYVSDRGGPSSLWAMDPSGLHQRLLYSGGEMLASPVWSPNSTMIAFWSLSGQTSSFLIFRTKDNYTATVTGSGPAAVQGAAAWSPDGSKLAFFVNPGTPKLMVYDLATGSSSALADAGGVQLSATWTSNVRLVFTASFNGSTQFRWFDISSNTTSVELTGRANFVAPSSGPDGRMAYFSDVAPTADAQFLLGYGSYNIWVANADGTNATYQYTMVSYSEASPGLTKVPYVPGTIDLTSSPSWCPAGGRLAYTSANSIFSALYIWDVGNWTTKAIGPTQVGVKVLQPSWSPDGSNIFFSSNQSGTFHIWVVSTTGGTSPDTFTGY